MSTEEVTGICVVDREDLKELDKDILALRKEMVECAVDKDIKIERLVNKLDAHIDKHKADHEELVTKVDIMMKQQKEWLDNWNQFKGARRLILFLIVLIPGLWGVYTWLTTHIRFNG